MYRFVVGVLRIITCFLLKIKVEGEENLPANGPVLLCFNHVNLFDPAILLKAVDRDLYGVVASDHGDNVLVKLFDRMGRAVLIRRKQNDREALEKCIQLLKRGKYLVISPEGTRHEDGILHKVKNFGPAYLSVMSGNPLIVPVGIIGAKGADKQAFKKRVHVSVKIGVPFKLDIPEEVVKTTKDGTRLPLRQLMDCTNDQIMTQIARLLPEDMRGDFVQIL